MRVRNLSSIAIPVALWRELAYEMRVSGNLPGALADHIGIYRKCKTLCVTIHPRRRSISGEVVTVGAYTYGRISLFPCSICGAGFMTQVFIHELVHAWLHQYHEKIYASSCELAERFADAAFIALGGKIRSSHVCGSYHLPLKHAKQNFPAFQRLAASLIRRRPNAIMRWRAPLAK
jgi:hypothetical protein